MSDNQLTPEQMQTLLKFASKKLGTTPDKLVKTVNEGNLSSLAPNLSAESREKLTRLPTTRRKPSSSCSRRRFSS